jgi:hypothetical protein
MCQIYTLLGPIEELIADHENEAATMNTKLQNAAQNPKFIQDLPNEQETKELRMVFKIHQEQKVPLYKFSKDTPQIMAPSEEEMIVIDEPAPQVPASQEQPPAPESTEGTQ